MLKAILTALLLVTATLCISCEAVPRQGGVALTMADWDGIARISSTYSDFAGTGWHAGDGLYVTCAHVVFGEPDVLVNGWPAELLAYDHGRDVAVLRSSRMTTAHPISLAGVGQRLYVRGFVGYGNRGVHMQTTGTMSAVFSLDRIGYDGGIQPGLSGSPVFNDDGRVVGMVSAAMGWNEYQPFSGVNGTMGILCSPAGIQAVLGSVTADSPAIPIPQRAKPVQGSVLPFLFSPPPLQP